MQRIIARATSHHGLITQQQAARLGMSRSAWYRAIASGRLDGLYPGVARLPGTTTTPMVRIAAAVLACGSGAVASHRSAASLWGVERPSRDPIDVTLPRGRRTMALPGVITHRPVDRSDLTVVRRYGIPVTSPARTAIDMAAVDARATRSCVEQLVISGATSVTALRSTAARHGRRGRNGATALRAVLDEWVLDTKPADSVLELATARLLRDHGLPAATFHARLAGYEVDFWFAGTPLVLECDGWEFHVRDRRQYGRDRDRDARLAAAGYITLRFTWEHVVRQPQRTAQRIRAALRRWAPEALNAA
jgi:very-short-patch-repair endonuclease